MTTTCDTMDFAIVNIDGERDELGFRLYWSNADGWVTPEQADLFDHDELLTMRLPIGGAWVPMDWSPA